MVANSGFGQVPLSFPHQKDQLEFIESNRIKYQTNQILQFIKKVESRHQLGEFLDVNKFDKNSFGQIISIPPLNFKTKEYNEFYHLAKYATGTGMSTLHIEKSLCI